MMSDHALVRLDGSQGEGGGQILRSALSLSLLTGRGFRVEKIRANRKPPGLRPQHVAAVHAAATLCGADASGAVVGARELVFRPRPYEPGDLDLDVGTAGSTALVLQTLHLPIALRATSSMLLTIRGGTFNTRAPSYPFLDETWRPLMARLGLGVELSMPEAGFYPIGGGRLRARLEPSPAPSAALLESRGPLLSIRGISGTLNLSRNAVAERMRDRALQRLAERNLAAEIELVEWEGRGQGAAIALSADFADAPAPFTEVGLGARGKPAEAVADEAVDALLPLLGAPGALDPHSADQVVLPLALAGGPSRFTVVEVTEHLRTNVATVRAFLDRKILIEEADPEAGTAGVVSVL